LTNFTNSEWDLASFTRW